MFDIYRPSGRFSASFVAMAIGLLIVAGIAGFVYQKGLDLIPWIYVNFMLSGGLGLGIGFAVIWMGTTGHCRNRPMLLLVAALAAIIALSTSHYTSYADWKTSIEEYWTAEIDEQDDLSSEERDQWVKETMEAHAEELKFSNYVDLRVETGWTLGRTRSSSRSKPTLSGILVWLIWLAEAILLIGAAVTVVYNDETFPYSEDMGAWADHPTAELYFDRPPKDFVKSLARSTTTSAMIPTEIPPNDGAVNSFLTYTVHSVPDAPQESWMSVRHGRMRRSKNGEMKESGRYLVRQAKVGTQEISRIQALAEQLERYEQEES